MGQWNIIRFVQLTDKITQVDHEQVHSLLGLTNAYGTAGCYLTTLTIVMSGTGSCHLRALVVR